MPEMTVRELVRLLLEFPQDSPVVSMVGHDPVGQCEFARPVVVEEDEEGTVPIGTVLVYGVVK